MRCYRGLGRESVNTRYPDGVVQRVDRSEGAMASTDTCHPHTSEPEAQSEEKSIIFPRAITAILTSVECSAIDLLHGKALVTAFQDTRCTLG